MLTMLEAPVDFITTAEAKGHLSVHHSRDDALIASEIKAAIAYLDGPNGYLGAAIAAQEWSWTFGAFSDCIRLPFGPLISVDALRYRNAAGGTTTVGPTEYYLFSDADGPYVRPMDDWPTDLADRDDAVTIEFTAGRTVVPESLKNAALILIGQLYMHREQDVDVRIFETSFGFHDLARPYRQSVVL